MLTWKYTESAYNKGNAPDRFAPGDFVVICIGGKRNGDQGGVSATAIQHHGNR